MGLGWSGMPHSRWIPSGSRGQVPWQGVAVPPQTHLLSPPCFPAQLVLLPRVSELPGFHGAEAAARREELERYRCLEAFRMAPPTPPGPGLRPPGLQRVSPAARRGTA